MSFGFSVGDFIAVAQLITNLTNSLRSVGGAKSEYQELVRELESLQKALQHLDRLGSTKPSSPTLDSIKYAALSCRTPLQEFLQKIEKYKKSLGVWGTPKGLRATADKLRWSFGHKDEICKMQNYLNIHVGTINILLAEHGLEMMDLASTRADTDQQHIRERLEESGRLIGWVKDNFAAQSRLVQNTNSVVGKLLQMLSGEFGSSWKSLGEMVAKICVSTQQIYGVVLDIQRSFPAADIRWTFFQDPLIVVDALGRKFPVPSEYDYGLLDQIIQHRFSDGPGALEVKAGNYELSYTMKSHQVLSFDMALLPGSKITMAILVSKNVLTDEACPMPHCSSIRSVEVPGGGRTCCECDVWFDQSTKKRKSLQDLLDALDEQALRSASEMGENPARKRARLFEDDMNHYRNVRCAIDEILDSIEIDIDESTNTIQRETTISANIRPLPELPDALSYLDFLKLIYADQMHIYNVFILILNAFKHQIFDTTMVYQLISRLFQGKDEALNRFEQFVPEMELEIYRSYHAAVPKPPMPDLLYEFLGSSPLPFMVSVPKGYFEKSRLEQFNWGPPTKMEEVQREGDITSGAAETTRKLRKRKRY